jgi:hypothetical protein
MNMRLVADYSAHEGKTQTATQSTPALQPIDAALAYSVDRSARSPEIDRSPPDLPLLAKRLRFTEYTPDLDELSDYSAT